MTIRQWAPIVFGRTARADLWWRAVPPDPTVRGWAEKVISDAVGGGRIVADGPRFLLACVDDHWLVGVASWASEFNSELVVDDRRPSSAFVGWMAQAPAN